jgi:hypothetical protein
VREAALRAVAVGLIGLAWSAIGVADLVSLLG